jgi:hypothetical protein
MRRTTPDPDAGLTRRTSMGDNMTSAPLAHTDVIVLDYLAALWAQSEDLSPELRDELMSTVADYISARRSAPGGALEDPAAILRRLGPPEALVDAARRGHVPPHIRLPALIPPPAPVLPRTVGGAPEYTAIGLLTVGSFVLPVVSPVAGILLVTSSPHWTAAEKVTGWILTGGSAAAGVVLTLFFATLPLHSGFAVLLIYLAMCVASTAAGVQLLGYLRSRG